MTLWMTFEQALVCAFGEASATGYRYRVRRSRGAVGWWITEETGDRW
jgi:hypothetical protein